VYTHYGGDIQGPGKYYEEAIFNEQNDNIHCSKMALNKFLIYHILKPGVFLPILGKGVWSFWEFLST